MSMVETKNTVIRPSRDEAEKAVEVLLLWAGDNPERFGLKDTPKRLVGAFEEYFQGYTQDASKELSKTFDDITGYKAPIIIRDIPFESHCEHHIAPFIGKAWVAYYPDEKVCGLSKIARVVDIYAKRLQNQEMLTRQIAEEIFTTLDAKGVAVGIDAVHHCMSTRGVRKHGSSTITTHFLGAYVEDENLQNQFMNILSNGIGK